MLPTLLKSIRIILQLLYQRSILMLLIMLQKHTEVRNFW